MFQQQMPDKQDTDSVLLVLLVQVFSHGLCRYQPRQMSGHAASESVFLFRKSKRPGSAAGAPCHLTPTVCQKNNALASRVGIKPIARSCRPPVLPRGRSSVRTSLLAGWVWEPSPEQAPRRSRRRRQRRLLLRSPCRPPALSRGRSSARWGSLVGRMGQVLLKQAQRCLLFRLSGSRDTV